MLVKRRVGGALVGAIVLLVGQFFWLGAAFNIWSGDGGVLPFETNYHAVAKFAAIAAVLTVCGLAAAAWISGGPRPLLATVLAVAVFTLGAVFAVIAWAGFDLFGTVGALAVAVMFGAQAPTSVADGHEV